MDESGGPRAQHRGRDEAYRPSSSASYSFVATSANRVFEVLAHGWLYPLWVVGASHMRDVDPGWPAGGTRIHHSVGLWPLVVQDATRVIAVEPGRMLELDARVWPTGAARVRLTLTPEGDNQTLVTMGEVFDRGPAARIPTPIRDASSPPRIAASARRYRRAPQRALRSADPPALSRWG
jgi:hypothetical protein